MTRLWQCARNEIASEAIRFSDFTSARPIHLVVCAEYVEELVSLQEPVRVFTVSVFLLVCVLDCAALHIVCARMYYF